MKLKTLIPKSEARRLVITRREEVSAEEIERKTKRIIELFSSADDFISARNVFCYVNSRPGEMDTHGLIDYMESVGKSIFLPKLNKVTKSFNRAQFTGWDSLIKNNEGYWEPRIGFEDDMSDIDLMIIPVLAVSVAGQRIGYGGGYYDNLLKTTRAPKYVPAFEFQLFDYIESSVHDVRVDVIITERRIIYTREL